MREKLAKCGSFVIMVTTREGRTGLAAQGRRKNTMELVYCGFAVIDEQLQLRKADDAFYRLAEGNVYSAITEFLCEADMGRLRDLLDGIWDGSRTGGLAAAHLQGKAQEKLYVIQLRREPFQPGSFVPVYMEFYAVEETAPLSRKVSWRDREAFDALLGMLDATFLQYDGESGQLEIRAGISGQILTLYQGSLGDWREKEMGSHIDPESRERFELLCGDLERGRASFCYSIRTDAFGEEGVMEPLAFQCRRLQMGASFRVAGVISRTQKNQKGALDAELVADAGLPVLSKASIIQYARHTFEKSREQVYLAVIDLDDFKTVNDTYGHLFGDEVLLRMVETIKNAVGRMGTLGRIGGDEMLLVLTGIENETELRNLLRSVRTDVEWMFRESSQKLRVTCSMGVAAYPADGLTYDQVFQTADRMLYLAKNKGKNRYIIYKPEIHDKAKKLAEGAKSGETGALREDKAGVMQRLVEEFLVRRIVTVEAQFRELAACFELDDITMVYDNGVSLARLCGETFTSTPDPEAYLEYEQGFLDGFDENGLLTVNGRFNVEGAAPQLFRKLEDQKVESALFYRMTKNGRMFGYVMFAKKSRRQMWSEDEKNLLGLAGKAMELFFAGK